MHSTKKEVIFNMILFNLLFTVILLHLSLGNIMITDNSLSSYSRRKREIDKCILNVGDSFLDLNNLQNPSGYEVTHDGRKFLLNICGTVPRCQVDNASVCEINPITGRPIGTLGYFNNLFILPSYKPIPGLKYQTFGRKKSKVEIKFKCNPRYSNHKISFEPQLGKTYKFLFESKDVCVFKNMNCVIHNVHNNIQYDLSSLYKKSGNWQVRNSSNSIYLNMCGSLNKISAQQNTECSYNDVQICLVNKNGVSKSLGTSLTEITSNEHMTSITFKDGSPCIDSSQTETQIDFYCSNKEKNPQLVSATTCKYHVIWNTPAACPYFVAHGKNCNIYDPLFGSRDIKTIFSADYDTTKQISNTFIRYNLCSSLYIPCGYYNNASVCLEYNNESISLGWYDKNIVSINGQISFKLIGETCSATKEKRTTNVKFICINSDRTSDNIKLSNNKCNADINIYTKLACIDNNEYDVNCGLEINNLKYNLESLKSSTNNYEVHDPDDPNIKYLLNVCKPIIFKNDAICHRYSGVCMRNSSEPNLTKKFTSLGYIATSLKPILENNQLKIRYSAGICPHKFLVHTSIVSEINFICGRESKPTLVSQDGCYYKFQWFTRHACPEYK